MKLLPTIILALAVAIEASPWRTQAQGTWRNGVWVPSQSSGSTAAGPAKPAPPAPPARPALPSFDDFAAFVKAGSNKKASQSKQN